MDGHPWLHSEFKAIWDTMRPCQNRDNDYSSVWLALTSPDLAYTKPALSHCLPQFQLSAFLTGFSTSQRLLTKLSFERVNHLVTRWLAAVLNPTASLRSRSAATVPSCVCKGPVYTLIQRIAAVFLSFWLVKYLSAKNQQKATQMEI